MLYITKPSVQSSFALAKRAFAKSDSLGMRVKFGAPSRVCHAVKRIAAKRERERERERERVRMWRSSTLSIKIALYWLYGVHTVRIQTNVQNSCM